MSEENVRTNKEDIKAKIRKRYAGIDPDLLEVIPAKEKPNIKDTTTMKRVAIYVRVSTDDPNQTTSFELQKNYYDDIISKNPSYQKNSFFVIVLLYTFRFDMQELLHFL